MSQFASWLPRFFPFPSKVRYVSAVMPQSVLIVRSPELKTNGLRASEEKKPSKLTRTTNRLVFTHTQLDAGEMVLFLRNAPEDAVKKRSSARTTYEGKKPDFS